MKQVFFIILILIFSCVAYCQVYYPVIQENKFWDQGYIYGYAGGCYIGPARYNFINGYVNHEGKDYRQTNLYDITGTPGPQGSICPPFEISNNASVISEMREDTNEHKVYIYDYNSVPRDQLLYDFTLQPGDTLKSLYAGSGDTLVLNHIDSVTLANGEVRHRYCFDTACLIYYIEEIGGRNGLFQPIVPIYGSVSPTIFCIKDTTELVLWYGINCETYFTGEKIKTPCFVKIWPNPTDNNFSVQISYEDLPSNFVLMDPNGKEILKKELVAPRTEIKLNEFNQGIYFYIITNTERVFNGKIIQY